MRPLIPLATLALFFAGCGGGGQGDPSVSSGLESQVPPGSSIETDKGGEASIEEFGEEARGGSRAEVASAFKAYLSALAGRDYTTVCAHLSATTRRSLEQLVGEGHGATSCPEILLRTLAPTAAGVARQQTNGDITRVRVEDDRAFVVFAAPGAKLYELTMVKEGGGWKAATVAASVLVPEL